jgi:hypothetical protein
MAALRRLYDRWRIRRQAIPDRLWHRTLAQVHTACMLTRSDRARLRECTTLFLRAKTFDGAAGLVVTDSMRAAVAVRACLPILNLGIEYYSGWNDIVIYPGDFRVRDEYVDDAGVVHQQTLDLCGESLSHGPMVLSWDAIVSAGANVDGHDLVIHECAHKIDMLNGAADGFPPLHATMDALAWTRDFHAGYDGLCAALTAGAESRIDAYAATDPAEFFAVMSETFFAAPAIVRADFPAIYAQLGLFYRQHPDAVNPSGR